MSEAARNPQAGALPVPRRTIVGLLVLTAATGIIDAASVLGLGHVFTANMTGNVVFLGFALGGAAGFSIGASLVALVAFMAGALLGGVLVRPGANIRDARRAFALEVVALVAAAVVATNVDTPATGGRRWALLVLLGAGMGVQNAVVRRLAVADLTTTVLTLTITGIASDSALAGGDNPRLTRRVASIVVMLSGAIAGARLESAGLGWATGAAAAFVIVGAVIATGTT
ncbi:MAG: hypothetical protein JWR83_1433 [Aeromicrobium sp.]|nr:hypothetical protein [Aeromicrobium sp.]